MRRKSPTYRSANSHMRAYLSTPFRFPLEERLVRFKYRLRFSDRNLKRFFAAAQGLASPREALQMLLEAVPTPQFGKHVTRSVGDYLQSVCE